MRRDRDMKNQYKQSKERCKDADTKVETQLDIDK
jgi:hypothetical protein